MLKAGCVEKQIRQTLCNAERVEIEECSLSPTYEGRFQPLAKDYETAKEENWRDGGTSPLSLERFLTDRLCEAARQLARLAADGKIVMRDAKGQIPEDKAENLNIGGEPHELLDDSYMIGSLGVEHKDITVNREQLLECFPRARGPRGN
jgi:hypothetical protein